jgi:Cu-Zn family superoxide dismutase
MLRYLPPAVIALALAGCATTTTRSGNLAIAELADANGRPIGTAALSRRGNETLINLSVSGTPGAVHGMHLHAVGKCEAPFTSAGPHLNPGGHQHGKDNPMGSHLGDLPNVTIGQNGVGTASASLGTHDAAIDAALFDADGSAIVLHAAADDYRTDPSGNSGARIACGVLTRS